MTSQSLRTALRPDYLVHSLTAASSMFLVNLRPLALVAIFGLAYGDEVQSVVGLVGSLTGIAIIISTGFVPTTVRGFAKLLQNPSTDSRTAIRPKLASEAAVAFAAMAVILVIASLLLAVAMSTGHTLFAAYWLAALPGMIVNPLGYILMGLFQARSRDVSNMLASGTGLGVNVLAALILAVAHPSPAVALGLLGAVSTLTAIFGLVYRAAVLRRDGIIDTGRMPLAAKRFKEETGACFRGIGERFAASVDGLVFLTTFSAAIAVAMTVSPADGAAIALAVSIMRAIIIPLKQFGFVGARMSLREGTGEGALTSRAIALSSLILLGSLALILGMLAATGSEILPLPTAITVMMALQLLLEPWAGIRYAFTKVVATGYSGVAALLLSYGVVPILGFVVLSVTGSLSATTIWGVLFATRVCFALLLNLPPALRGVR